LWRAADRGARLTNQILAEHQLAAEGDVKVLLKVGRFRLNR